VVKLLPHLLRKEKGLEEAVRLSDLRGVNYCLSGDEGGNFNVSGNDTKKKNYKPAVWAVSRSSKKGAIICQVGPDPVGGEDRTKSKSPGGFKIKGHWR